ncbi:hypothetical protein P8452_05249 [Trifolium repens]|nr:hypothetical protein P8452_05249 [Trifolium repens]
MFGVSASWFCVFMFGLIHLLLVLAFVHAEGWLVGGAAVLVTLTQRKIKVKLSGNNVGKRSNKGDVSLYSVAGTDNDSSMLANKYMMNEPSKMVEALPLEKGQLVAVDEELQDQEREFFSVLYFLCCALFIVL